MKSDKAGLPERETAMGASPSSKDARRDVGVPGFVWVLVAFVVVVEFFVLGWMRREGEAARRREAAAAVQLSRDCDSLLAGASPRDTNLVYAIQPRCRR